MDASFASRDAGQTAIALSFAVHEYAVGFDRRA